MGLFKNGYEKDLDDKMERVRINMSNNYKDAAQSDLVKLEQTLEEYIATGKLKEKSQKFYQEQVAIYKDKMKGFTHKEQKPYWT